LLGYEDLFHDHYSLQLSISVELEGSFSIEIPGCDTGDPADDARLQEEPRSVRMISDQ
jgi:hypothetical protein